MTALLTQGGFFVTDLLIICDEPTMVFIGKAFSSH